MAGVRSSRVGSRHPKHTLGAGHRCEQGPWRTKLNFYDRRDSYFGRDRERLASLFAGQCAITGFYWHVASEASTLATAMRSRATIEQAKGIIMATTGCSPDDAFDILREQSQRENRKLREIAEEIVRRQKR